jgi:oligopeptide transport system permease protein
MDISTDSFDPVPKDIDQSQSILRPSMSYWQDAWRRLKKNKLAIVCMWILAFMIVISVVGPILYPHYREQNLEKTLQSPSNQYWFGSDELGRDQFSRVLRGGRVSLFIGITVSFITLIIGILYGGISGFFGGWIDDLMMRTIDIIITIPDMVILILLLVIFQPGIGTLILALSLTGWAGMARLVRGQVLQIKEADFVLVAKVLGASPWRIITKHLLPNTLGIIIVRVTMMIPAVIFEEAFLSFIGLGVRVPEASWGNLAQGGTVYFPNHMYLFWIPAAVICVTMLAFNLFGDGLRDALDPKMRK